MNTTNKKLFAICFSLGVFSLALFLHDDINRSMFIWVNSLFPQPILWVTITNLGGFMCASCLLIIVLRNNLQLLANALVAAFILNIVVQGGKTFFSISRPEHLEHFPDLIKLGPLLVDYSMPSGHTSTAFMTAMFIIRCYELTGWRLWLVIASASLVGLSRMAVGAHWPSDVLAGAALGSLIGSLCANLRFNTQTKAITYAVYLLCLPFIALAIHHGTTITTLTLAITESVIVSAGLVALWVWVIQVNREIKAGRIHR